MDLMLFFVLCDNKLNIVVFWTASVSKEVTVGYFS